MIFGVFVFPREGVVVVLLFYICKFYLCRAYVTLTGIGIFELLQEASPSVVFIKDLEIDKIPKTSSADVNLIEDENAKVEGTGSGFIWDKFGHIVSIPL